VYWWRDDSLSLLDVDRTSPEWQIMPDEEFRSMFAELPASDAEPATTGARATTRRAPSGSTQDGDGADDEGEYDDEVLT
jgi:hypothetical protein